MPPLHNIQHFRQQSASTGQVRAAFARQPAAAPPGVPGPRPAPVRLVPEGWPNLRQQQTASASQRPVNSTCSAQLPVQHAQAPQHQPQANRLVLMPSLIQPHSNVQQGSMQPPASKRPAGQLSAPVTKRVMQLAPPAPPPSAARPAAAATLSMQAQQRRPLAMQAHPAPPPLLLEAGPAQTQVHLGGGITIPGPAGALQRRMQQGLVQTGPAAGLSGPPRVILPSQASEPDPAFPTPQWMAAVHACSRLEGDIGVQHHAAALHAAVMGRTMPGSQEVLTSPSACPTGDQQGLQGLERIIQSEERAGKVAWMAVCVVSMSLTGNGDAFARLKVCFLNFFNCSVDNCTAARGPSTLACMWAPGGC